MVIHREVAQHKPKTIQEIWLKKEVSIQCFNGSCVTTTANSIHSSIGRMAAIAWWWSTKDQWTSQASEHPWTIWTRHARNWKTATSASKMLMETIVRLKKRNMIYFSVVKTFSSEINLVHANVLYTNVIINMLKVFQR